jgi:hypothetical protein
MRAPDLTLDEATVDRFARDGVIAPTPHSPAPAAGRKREGPTRWQEKLALLERNDRGRENVRTGKVHPQVFDFMRDAERLFSPRESVVAEDPRAPNTIGRTLRSWQRGFVKDYLDKLRKEMAVRPPRRNALTEHGPGSDLFEGYNHALRAAEAGAESITCQVCLVVRPGRPPEVVLAASSGNEEVDEAATEALRKASLRRELDEQMKPQRTCYSFSASVYRIPPVPMVGCSFDESLLKLGCYYPGKMIYRLKVNLDLVDYTL